MPATPPAPLASPHAAHAAPDRRRHAGHAAAAGRAQCQLRQQWALKTRGGHLRSMFPRPRSETWRRARGCGKVQPSPARQHCCLRHGTALRGAASKLRGPLPWRPRLQPQTSSYSSCVVEAVWLFLLLLESGSSASSCSRQNRQAHPSAEGCAAADAPQVAEVFGGAGVVEGDADDGVERDDHGHNEEGCSRRASRAKPPARQKVTWRGVKRSRQGDVAARP